MNSYISAGVLFVLTYATLMCAVFGSANTAIYCDAACTMTRRKRLIGLLQILAAIALGSVLFNLCAAHFLDAA